MVPDIEIQHLSVCFDTAQGPVYAVNDLSTTFRAGRISGVIGESGSGKSVMGMSLLRLLPNTARVTGKCFFGEDELYSMPLRRLRRLRGAAIGLIPQNPGASLDPVMKLRRQLTEAITTHGRWKRREAEAQAAELLRRFGFEEPERILNQYSFQMSGGMNQRVISAMGLMNRPKWAIADEPTKGLDAILRRQVYQVLKEISETDTEGMIVITHDIALAGVLCDRLMVLYKGSIMEVGDTRTILEHPAHPYTKGLVASLPAKGMNPIGRAVRKNEGNSGCSFYPRCPYAADACKNGPVPEAELPDGRKVRCVLYA